MAPRIKKTRRRDAARRLQDGQMTMTFVRRSALSGCGKLALALSVFLSLGAQASEIRVSGRTLTISGEIVPGDQFKFRDLLKEAGAAAIRLNSPGGDIYTAGEIARQIRAAGSSTIVDAGKDSCISACTILFAGGQRRLYLNAERVGESPDPSDFRGLGFHQANHPGHPGPGRYSGEGTAQMKSLYYEFGVPNAATLAQNASPDEVFLITGREAVAMGIATASQDAEGRAAKPRSQTAANDRVK
jgi:hypothetical protein